MWAYNPTKGYCYDNADRLVWTDDATMANPGYDAYGNTTALGSSTMAYDDVNRHVSTTTGATTVSYKRDALDRIVERKLNGVITARYAHCDSSDSACATLDGAGYPDQKFISLIGDVSLTKQGATTTWSYSNIHGDVMAIANGSGVFHRQYCTSVRIRNGLHNLFTSR